MIRGAANTCQICFLGKTTYVHCYVNVHVIVYIVYRCILYHSLCIVFSV